MTVEMLSLIAGSVLSLAFKYIPKLNTWYAKQESEIKSSIMGGLLILVGLASYGLSCTEYGALFGLEVVCDKTGFATIVATILRALATNQATYVLFPETKAVKEAKLERDMYADEVPVG